MHADSTDALGQALSTTKPRVNKVLILNLRRALNDCRAIHGYQHVKMLLVKARSGHPRRDKTDALALEGSSAIAFQYRRLYDPGD